MNRIPRWRIAAAALVLAALAVLAGVFAPIYFRNYRLQEYVSGIPQRVAAQTSGAPSDDAVRSWVVDKARALNLPVVADDVQVVREPGTARVRRIDVRYAVQVDLPGYTVRLHFYPGAGSR